MTATPAPISQRDPGDETATPAVLRDQIRRVHEARCGSQRLQELLETERQVNEERIADLVKVATASKRTLETEEQLLRELAVAHYKTTSDKHPAPGVDIRIVKTLEYDAGQAFAWAKATGMALTLDRKAYEKIALANGGLTGTKIEEVPRATIAQDLTEAVKGG